MTGPRLDTLWLKAYVGLALAFVFAPIAVALVFSFNSSRFPTLPLQSFTLEWYEDVASNPELISAFGRSALVALLVAALSTAIGFATAYTDYRFSFRGKGFFVALALLPPTIPSVIMGLAMLAWLSRLAISGTIAAIVVAHTVICIPFATAIIRLRLSEMDAGLELAAWNLGASPWTAVRTLVLPFARRSLLAAMALTAAVSFDEYAVAWFVSGLQKTVPVVVLEILTGNVDPRINAIGAIVFVTSMSLVIAAQILIGRSSQKSGTAE